VLPAALPLDRRALLLRAACGLGALAFPWAVAAGAEPIAAVEALRGEAFAGKERRPLQIKSALAAGEPIYTGADARLIARIGSTTRLFLGERAEASVPRFAADGAGEIVLTAGALFCDRPLDIRSTVRVRTPYGLIVARGARFFLGPSRDVFGVFVEKGRATVEAGGRRITVRTGQGTDIRSFASAPTPPVTWKPARVTEALVSVRAEPPAPAPDPSTPPPTR
jgi:ferric-dicitrate binding protein FerR (iron transport regulator)